LSKIMQEIHELYGGRRALLSTMIAAGASIQFSYYILTLFIPPLIDEFGWAKSQVAVTGAMGAFGAIAFVIAGRFADRFGTRRTALIGVIGLPICYLLLSIMDGEINSFYIIYALILVLGSTTSISVYGRIIATRFEETRGLAFALMLSSAPFLALATVSLLELVIATEGWRAGFRTLAVAVLLLGLLALRIMPQESTSIRGVNSPIDGRAFGFILRSKSFWVIATAMLLCNLGSALNTLQLKPMLLEQDLSSSQAATIMPAFASGVLGGRLLSGFAFRSFSTPIVSAAMMGLPSIGLALMASPFDQYVVVYLATMLIGVSQGAEADIGAFTVARYVGTEYFGTGTGLITSFVIGISSFEAICAGFSYHFYDSLTPFIIATSIASFTGAFIFLLLFNFRDASCSK